MLNMVFKVLRKLPLPVLKSITSFSIMFVYLALPKRRRMAEDNIRLAIGGDYKKTALRTYLYFANMLAINIKYLGDEEFIKKHVKIKGIENYEYAKSLNRGVIFTTAHFGNWEMMVCAFALLYEPIYVMVRPLDNKSVDRLVESVRSSCGNKILSKRLSAFEFIRILRKNGVLGVLVDQASSNDTFRIDFFNRKARVSEGIGIFSHKLNIPILPAYMVELENTYEVVIEKPILPNVEENFRKDVEDIMKKVYSRFEEWIRREPHKYFWMHNRWK